MSLRFFLFRDDFNKCATSSEVTELQNTLHKTFKTFNLMALVTLNLISDLEIH